MRISEDVLNEELSDGLDILLIDYPLQTIGSFSNMNSNVFKQDIQKLYMSSR